MRKNNESHLPVPVARATETPAETAVIFPSRQYWFPCDFFEFKSGFLDVRLSQINFKLCIGALNEKKELKSVHFQNSRELAKKKKIQIFRFQRDEQL